MKGYRQLAQEQRYMIYRMYKAKMRKATIAQLLGIHKSTLSRELKRNSESTGYDPEKAHTKAQSRLCRQARTSKFTLELKRIIREKLARYWSPEQITGYLRKKGMLNVSHVSIYHYIHQDKKSGGILHAFLRQYSKRRKPYGRAITRNALIDRQFIDERPSIVDEKSRIGDWEVDTMVGKNHKSFLITAVERFSKITLIAKTTCKKALVVSEELIKLLKPFKRGVKTITSDNGTEFAYHKSIAESLDTEMYFAHPYCSWQRGLNENTNGLIRQFLPKKSDFSYLSDLDISIVSNRLNTRPRKSLGFATPIEVFFDKYYGISL